ncbi:hypothetical protein JD844_008047 [Phrynosoma platyrhinos]|uniref:SH3 domain-containing protein n=1 Tax=Phrynosoma platyrhinos TaxID=52577 RepID=A0ABQ7TF31_PHRPL|nr:hypothetical protein JD844_008047 [Phrynosoma platyrhinos]
MVAQPSTPNVQTVAQPRTLLTAGRQVGIVDLKSSFHPQLSLGSFLISSTQEIEPGLGSVQVVFMCIAMTLQDSSSGSPPTPESHPPRSRSCPVSANLLPTARPSPATGGQTGNVGSTNTQHKKEGSPAPLSKKEVPLETGAPLAAYELSNGASIPSLMSSGLSLARVGGHHPEPQWKVGCAEAVGVGSLGAVLSRPLNALKWREYRRRNPLGLDRVSGLAGSLDWKQQEGRLSWRNPVFEFPGALNAGRPYAARLNGQSMKQLQLNYSDFFPDYFSLAEKPPAEFCLSPDGNTESISIDLLQKKGRCNATVAAPKPGPGGELKAKLGNSSVSPNVGHLILKYLCPAIRDILGDGLKAYVLDVIIGQRRNIPWSVVEASTQLDILQVHYQPVGFLSLSHGVCQGLFEELLLLLQPLSLLPFNLDLLFEHHLLQMGKEQQQKKELLRIKQDLLLSAHSTLQLMRTQGQSDAEGCGGGRWGPAGQNPGPEGLRGTPEETVPAMATTERVKGVGAPCRGTKKAEVEEEEEEAPQRERQKAPEGPQEPKKDKQASWWYQLMQSSQVYIEGSADGARFIRYERKKKAVATARPAEPKKGPPPPPREGVVEGAEACPITEVPIKDRPPMGAPAVAAGSAQKLEPSAQEEAKKEKSHLSWMGSPPDSVLTELKRTKEKEDGPPQKPGGDLVENGISVSIPENSQPKWGHLFGSRRVPKDPKHANSQVKALCHHIATEAGQLSFQKGDLLRVLGKADADWLRCDQGGKSGLVPIMYVTHVEDEDY